MKHYKHVSCKINHNTIAKKDIIAFSKQHQMELPFYNKTNSYAQVTFKDLTKTFEVVIEQIEHCQGITGVQLAYVPCKNLSPKHAHQDPLGNYPSLDAKVIACAPILKDDTAGPDKPATAIALLEQNGPFRDTFCINMLTVWNVLYEMFGQTPAWLHAALTKKEKNRHKLYCLLFDHHLGSDHVNHLANKMEAHLASLTYRGKQKNWDWFCYTDAHNEQHTIAKTLMHYSGLEECSKVRHLLSGIQDNAVQPVVCQVLAMREDDKTFMTFLALFADFISHLKQNPSNVCHVAEFGSGGCGSSSRGRGAGGGGGSGHGRGGAGGGCKSASGGGVLDQSEVDKVTWLQANMNCIAKEYAKFTAAKKAWVHKNRSAKKSPTLKHKLAAVVRGEKDTAMESTNARDLFDDVDLSKASKRSTCSNLTNPTLVCQDKSQHCNDLRLIDM
jgi:hypothetical protein